MKFSWFMYLSILIYFSLQSAYAKHEYDEEFDDETNEDDQTTTTTNLIRIFNSSTLPTTTTTDENYSEKWKIKERKLTTPILKTTTPKQHTESEEHDNNEDYSHDNNENDESDESDEKKHSTYRTPANANTKSSSSSSTIKSIIYVRTNTKVPSTYSTQLSILSEQRLPEITLSPEELAILTAKLRRDRLLLKIYAILVIIIISGLAVGLIVFRRIRQSKRYHQYQTPATMHLSGNSKHPV